MPESALFSRRAALTLLGAGPWTARALWAAESPLRFTGLDHIEFWASDVEKSRDFYARIFGNAVMKNNKTTRRYLQLGSAYIAIDKGADAGRVDHFCTGIPGFDIAALHSYLQQADIAFRDYPSGRDLAVTDPDGTRAQLAADNGWKSLAGGTASADSIALPAEPIFKPSGLDHILLNVTDQAKAAEFYAKIFGAGTPGADNRIWFQTGNARVGLLQTPAGQRAGVNHFCISAAAFDFYAVTKKLQQAGARIEPTETAGDPEFRDPDGLLIQVKGPQP
ncbi:MAG TPA: VOC family protein [Bryobacteraceae bacterium]|jgi:catechol 2,3-dioxygenase-like lactoylglutathione lyase family enzyme